MGLEIALLKKPLIICGETFSKNKGYGLDITSKSQYIDLLNDIQHFEADNEKNFEIAIKYAHYFYFRRMIDLPIKTISPNTGQNQRHTVLQFSELSELQPGKDKSIDTICDGIINLSEFIL